ncbi:hypothetical protein BDV37DRAFT_289185 [Aspergillus pseudonomiae]|uniref:Uncharacterized protein n=1 Tax=Aspergillus pseudonomiae TaxID=1506151 RepID=A0A5N7CVT7_9EURO|nr:uncharacterized protein BDV37DRAFT_289185 [Aspergillus pseudonomiae]KAE8397728.1 hypothetical protein BDV37DRAFT_289185 [Aspergillus pseudonomiae]
MAGFEATALGNYYLPRAKIQPPSLTPTLSCLSVASIWSDPIFVREDYSAFAAQVKQSVRDVEEPEEVRLRQALPALAERLDHIRQDLQQGLGHAIKEWGSKTQFQPQEINEYLHDIMGGRVVFTLQAVSPDATEAFVFAVQSPRPMPEFVPVPPAATAPAGSSATSTQETF